MPTVSSNPGLHRYDTHLCESCGIAFIDPQIEEAALKAHYNTAYRRSSYAVQLHDREIDVPISIPLSGVSFKRFQTFYDLVTSYAKARPEILPQSTDWIVDFGAYQGMFLYAARKAWNCQTIATDYNVEGIAFAKAALGIDEAKPTVDIYSDSFAHKTKYAVLVHVFEHLREPLRFLEHLKSNVLEPDGLVYLEIPNLLASPLSDPTHFIMYSPNGLKKIMARAGFATLALEVHGKPATGLGVWENDRMNVSGLFQASREPAALPGGGGTTYEELRRSHRRIALASVTRYFGTTARSVGRLFYYLSFVVVLENFSGALSRRLKDRLSRLIRRVG